MEEQIEGLEIGDRVILDGVDVSDFTITMGDCMSAGHCVRGIRQWFSHYELDFRLFVKQGISGHIFLSTRDGHAIQIVRHKLRTMNG